MGWVYLATLWDNSNYKYKMSSTSKERVEDTVNNVDVDDRHIDGHADTRTWSDVVSRGTIRRRNTQLS